MAAHPLDMPVPYPLAKRRHQTAYLGNAEIQIGHPHDARRPPAIAAVATIINGAQNHRSHFLHHSSSQGNRFN